MKKMVVWILWVVIIINMGFSWIMPVPARSGVERDNNPLINNPKTSLIDNRSVYLPVLIKNTPTFTPYGVEMSWGITNPGGLNEMVQAGVSWARRNSALLWSAVEPQPGQRIWSSSLETELINAKTQHIEVVLIIRGTPSWAQKYQGYSCGPIVENQLVAFSSFLYDVVNRYSVAPYYVKYFEIWNEPDVDPFVTQISPDEVYGCWGDSKDTYYGGRYYGEMLKIVYPRIKAANPNVQVLLGGLLLNCDPFHPDVCPDSKPSKFLQGILVAGAGSSFDGVSFHAYDYYPGGLGIYANSNWKSSWNSTGPVLAAKVEFINYVLGEYNIQGKYLMNTESALIDLLVDCDSVCEETKAYYVAQVFSMALAEKLRANIWFAVFGWRNSGLLMYPDRTPLPAYHAFKFARYELSDSTPLSSSVDYPGVKKYEFDRGDKHIWVLWSIDGATHDISFSGSPIAVWDVFGTMVLITNPLSVTRMPYYVEFSP